MIRVFPMEGRAGINKGLAGCVGFRAGRSDRSFAGGRQSKCRLFVVLKNRRGRCVVGKVGP